MPTAEFDFEFNPTNEQIASALFDYICPAGESHTGDDPTTDHGHTACMWIGLAIQRLTSAAMTNRTPGPDADQPHGTNAAIRRHQRHGEPLCEPCRVERNRLAREYYRKRNRSTDGH